MYCESCGAKNDDSSQFCENCGAPLVPVTATPPESPAQAEAPRGGNIYAKIGVVVGVLGIFLFFFFIFGPLAIVLGYIGYRNGDEKTGKIAMIVGAVATVISLLVFPVFL